MYYVEFLELGSGTYEASASSFLREGDWDHIRDMIIRVNAVIFVYLFICIFLTIE